MSLQSGLAARWYGSEKASCAISRLPNERSYLRGGAGSLSDVAVASG
jgi:hypothetical protein